MDRLEKILGEIAAHRAHQDAKHGPQRDLPVTREDINYLAFSEAYLRERYERRKARGLLSHADIILEELAEAFEAPDQKSMRAELVQVAACIVKAIEALDWQRENGGAK